MLCEKALQQIFNSGRHSCLKHDILMRQPYRHLSFSTAAGTLLLLMREDRLSHPPYLALGKDLFESAGLRLRRVQAMADLWAHTVSPVIQVYGTHSIAHLLDRLLMAGFLLLRLLVRLVLQIMFRDITTKNPVAAADSAYVLPRRGTKARMAHPEQPLISLAHLDKTCLPNHNCWRCLLAVKETRGI